MINPRNELVPIRTVSQLTGVNPVTLRAWERRYGLIQPKRTPKGHRLYSRDDIDLIHRVLDLVNRGMSIGQVREALESGGAAASDATEADDSWQQYRSRMLVAITRFDEFALDEAYNEALALYPVHLVTRRLVIPLLEELGDRWAEGKGSVAEEHFFGCYLRNKLGARFHHRPRYRRGPRLLLACLPDEYHEIGLLLFALAASNHSLDTVLLGANLPLEELPAAVSQAGAKAVVLSGSTTPSEATLREAMPALMKRIEVPVFVGGTGPARVADILAEQGAIPLGGDIEAGLRKLIDMLDSMPGKT